FHRQEHRRERERDLGAECVLLAIGTDADETLLAVDANRASIRAVLDGFDARDGARGKEREERFPIEGRAVIEAEDDSLGCIGAVRFPHFARWPTEALSKERIEATHAAKAARERD